MSGAATPTRPTAPIELSGTGEHLAGEAVSIPNEVLAQLRLAAPTITDLHDVAEVSRDWWPLSMHWALNGEVPRRAAAVCRPESVDSVAAVLSICHQAHIPVTAAGGRSGVCGAAVPVYGGVLMDLTGMAGIVAVDIESGLVEVLAGTFGPDLEAELRGTHRLTVGHFPQSFDIATVGGWVACSGAGQYSTRYGKIGDIVAGLEVVLADGTTVRTGVSPAGSFGPDLGRMFIGSEGTMGVITRVWLRTHPLPPHEQRAAYSFDTFEQGIEACRRIMQRGATPAVLRLYDARESQRGQGGDGTECIMLVLDEGDPAIVGATMSVVAQECNIDQGGTARPAPIELIDQWLQHRNDTSGLQALTRKGFVVDTMEIAAPWRALPAIFRDVPKQILGVSTARAATCHLSHSYTDGACLYFTFAATPPPEEVEATYIALWDAGQRAVLAGGGNLSHHHGVGLNRSRFMDEALGSGLGVLQRVKDALDPTGILNPGKLGLAGPFGNSGAVWP